jgi:hypothetical protein
MVAGFGVMASGNGGRPGPGVGAIPGRCILWVAATLRVIGQEAGAKIVASGHEEERGARRIVTRLTLG